MTYILIREEFPLVFRVEELHEVLGLIACKVYDSLLVLVVDEYEHLEVA